MMMPFNCSYRNKNDVLQPPSSRELQAEARGGLVLVGNRECGTPCQSADSSGILHPLQPLDAQHRLRVAILGSGADGSGPCCRPCWGPCQTPARATAQSLCSHCRQRSRREWFPGTVNAVRRARVLTRAGFCTPSSHSMHRTVSAWPLSAAAQTGVRPLLSALLGSVSNSCTSDSTVLVQPLQAAIETGVVPHWLVVLGSAPFFTNIRTVRIRVAKGSARDLQNSLNPIRKFFGRISEIITTGVGFTWIHVDFISLHSL
jgi:hypothetical protein